MRSRHFRTARPLIVEALEQRIVLDSGGLGATADPLESVIVMLKDDVTSTFSTAQEVLGAHPGPVEHLYEHAVKGFSISLPPAAIAAISGHPLVRYVEPNLVFQVAAQTTPTGVDRVDADQNSIADIDQGSLPETPLDIDIAILDTGIDASHSDLNIYTAGSKNFVTGLPDDAWHDGYGHGTHVAGIAAASDNGIGVVGAAPGARGRNPVRSPGDAAWKRPAERQWRHEWQPGVSRVEVSGSGR